MTTNLVPPLKFHGGKRYLAKRILELMPKHLHYVEPYFGGGRVLFARDPQDPRYFWDGLTSDKRRADGVSEVASDLNGDLMNFYRVLKSPELRGRLFELLDLTLHSQHEWEAARGLLASAGGDAVERAAALFTCVRQSREGGMTCYAPSVRTRLRGGRNDNVNGWLNAVAGLEAVHRRLQQVQLFNLPALKVIRQEDTLATLFYLDPPYVPETRAAPKAYGNFEMTEADHRELLDVLRQAKGKVMLSGYPSALYDEMLAGWKQHTFDLPNNAAGGKVKDRETEVVWCNF
jgi:DNA adenine methylase